ncbi:MAG: aminomethyltransferase family protein [Acidobacteriota bacterium]|nr:aminomethyltransferase family protein [Acidobacteriota bacterium]
MPVPTPLHDRTFPLCTSLNYRDWAGYYAVSAYETHHEHEYNAIRNGAALIDISPLFKYILRGAGATALVDRVITRSAEKMKAGQVYYTPWCDERGHVIDDGTVTRIEEDAYRWTAAEPNYRWLHDNARGLSVEIEDASERIAALALQGPTSGELLLQAADADIASLKYFRMIRGTIQGIPVEISRTGYTGDMGFEIWVAADKAVAVWDVLMKTGRAFGIKPAGMLALDVSRVEAGLLLIDVDFFSARRAQIASQLYTPFEMGLDRLVDLSKGRFVGRDALAREKARGPARRIVGLDFDWPAVERIYERVGLPPMTAATASRVAVPVYSGGRQAGRATSTTWSPVLKRMIALATVDAQFSAPGTELEVEHTVDAVRHRVAARVAATPFYNPPQKTGPITARAASVPV